MKAIICSVIIGLQAVITAEAIPTLDVHFDQDATGWIYHLQMTPYNDGVIVPASFYVNGHFLGAGIGIEGGGVLPVDFHPFVIGTNIASAHIAGEIVFCEPFVMLPPLGNQPQGPVGVPDAGGTACLLGLGVIALVASHKFKACRP